MSDMNPTRSTRLRNSAANPLTWFLLVAFLIAIVVVTYLTYISVRDFVAEWKLTQGEAAVSQERTNTRHSTLTLGSTPAGEDRILTPLQKSA
jgi:hypothetical protein